ncbi:MAG: hypothetical protein IT385_11300 [Deltaproteobacteria bacterium]|nr:hypothetical protein [Deltaproteobacteria bacterium]
MRHALITFVLAACTPGLVACELDPDECAEAKAHLCSKVEQQLCATATMQNAIERIRTACGVDEAERFAPAAQAYCQSATGAGTFDPDVCAQQ